MLLLDTRTFTSLVSKLKGCFTWGDRQQSCLFSICPPWRHDNVRIVSESSLLLVALRSTFECCFFFFFFFFFFPVVLFVCNEYFVYQVNIRVYPGCSSNQRFYLYGYLDYLNGRHMGCVWIYDASGLTSLSTISVILRRCLVATGRSMLTFIVLPH